MTGGTTGQPYFGIKQEVLERAGYVEEEYFFEGTANSYKEQGKLGADGRWTLKPFDSAPYKTRMLVHRPKDPSRFNGNVVVEWFNVSAGHDAAPDFIWNYPEVFRSGIAYVSVSAQKAGVETGGAVFSIPGDSGGPLKKVDPERYESLAHPGDQYSFDIFTQAALALKSPQGVDPLAGMRPKRIIGDGQSQSAARLTSYVNGVHPLAKTYDGFFIHSHSGHYTTFGTGAGISFQSTNIRTDSDTPVLQVETESEVAYAADAARQPDSDKVRTWEIAGGSHVDKKALDQTELFTDTSILGAREVLMEECGYVNDSHMNYVMRRGLVDLFTWADGGPAPASGEPMEKVDGKLVRDEYGNVKGGVRTPAVDVPIAALSGVEGHGTATGLNAAICGVFGSTKPLDDATLRTLYPTHEDYVEKVTQATDAAIDAGFIREADRDSIIGDAEAANIPPS